MPPRYAVWRQAGRLLAKSVTINAKDLFQGLAKVAAHCALGQIGGLKGDEEATLTAFGLETRPRGKRRIF